MMTKAPFVFDGAVVTFRANQHSFSRLPGADAAGEFFSLIAIPAKFLPKVRGLHPFLTRDHS